MNMLWRFVNGVFLLFLITIMHSDLIQFLSVFNIVVGMFAVTRDGMGFGWARTYVLMGDESITAYRIHTLY